jgi:hypothetical protein
MTGIVHHVGQIGNLPAGLAQVKPTPESKKTPVLTLLERGGNVRSFPLERATLKYIKPIVN